MPARDQKQIAPPTREQVWELIDAADQLGGPGRDLIRVRLLWNDAPDGRVEAPLVLLDVELPIRIEVS